MANLNPNGGVRHNSLPGGAQPTDASLRSIPITEKAKETSAWDIYNTEAKKVDDELVKDWTDSLNSLLVFVSRVIYS